MRDGGRFTINPHTLTHTHALTQTDFLKGGGGKTVHNFLDKRNNDRRHAFPGRAFKTETQHFTRVSFIHKPKMRSDKTEVKTQCQKSPRISRAEAHKT